MPVRRSDPLNDVPSGWRAARRLRGARCPGRGSGVQCRVVDRPFALRWRLAIPQDHGSWVFLLTPLVVGLAAIPRVTLAVGAVVLGAFAGFLIRQPAAVLVKAWAGRRGQADLAPAAAWAAVYAVLGLVAVAVLVAQGAADVLWLGVPAVPVFGWQLRLVARREERRQELLEVLAAVVLGAVAPALLRAASGTWDPSGWVIWALVATQSGASITHAYLRLAQREAVRRRAPSPSPAVAMRWTTGNIVLAAACATAGVAPAVVVLPFVVQWAETLRWAVGAVSDQTPSAIGRRQFVVSTVVTVLLAACWA